MKILVIEDEMKLADCLARALSEDGHVVDVSGNGVEGLSRAIADDYDVMVLDWMLPGLDGLSVLRAFRAAKATPVLLLTARDGIEDRVMGLQQGADDYLVKPCSLAELRARVIALGRRSGRMAAPAVPDSARLVVGDLQLDLFRRQAWRDGARINLTAKEFGLLALLMRRQGQVQSRMVLAEQVWDMHFHSNTNVVDVAVRRLRAKVDDPYPSRVLHTVRGMGYVCEQRAA